MLLRFRFALLAGLAVLGTPAMAQHNTQRGAALGGLAGAAAGGLIGDHNDKAGPGALIGGAIGAVTGAVLGNAHDRDAALARPRAAWQTPPVAAQQAVTPTDVIQMSRSGLSDSVIVTQIRQRGLAQRLEVHDIIMLHQQGVSETVITAMQQSAGAAAPSAAPVQAAPSPVVVEQHYRVVPHYIAPAPHYYYHHYHRRHRHPYWELSVDF